MSGPWLLVVVIRLGLLVVAKVPWYGTFELKQREKSRMTEDGDGLWRLD